MEEERKKKKGRKVGYNPTRKSGTKEKKVFKAKRARVLCNCVFQRLFKGRGDLDNTRGESKASRKSQIGGAGP